MHTCGRRCEGPMGNVANEDSYDAHSNSCSYCGSLNPTEFMSRLEAGDVSLDPTDKNYKVYILNSGGKPFVQRYRTDSLPFKGWESPEHTWVVRDIEQTKFYFQHLSEEQKKRFVQLLNENKLKFNTPGRFYVMPFFIRKEV